MPPDDDKTLSGILRTLGLPQTTPAEAGPDSEKDAIQGSPDTQCLDQRIEAPGSAVARGPNVHGMPPSERTGDSPLPAARGLLELANAAGDIGGVIQNTGSWDWDMTAEAMSQGHMVHPDYVPESAALQGFSGKVLTPPQQQSVSGGVPSCPSLEDDNISSTESVDELVDQLSDRVGTLHIKPGGHIRFYGSTSNFNLLETPASDVNMNVHRTIRNDGTELLDRLRLNKNVPTELEDHLISLYFTWQDPSFHAVDRRMFEEAKIIWRDKGEDTSYYSEALRNAM
jgi:hypothetical protein